MTGLLWTVVVFLGGLGMTAIGDMVSEEVRDRLDHVPHAILRLAARRLDPEQRATIYEEVWLPDLAYFLRGDEARPVTRLVQGTRFAVGILMAGRRMTRQPQARIHSLSILVDADCVRISGYPGREWDHKAFTEVMNAIMERAENNLAFARGVFARRRAMAYLRSSSLERERVVNIMQEQASNRPQSRPERELPSLTPHARR